MKTIITTAILLLTAASAVGQHMVSALQVEYTVTGPQYGTSLTLESKSQWGVGVFYQAAVKPADDNLWNDRFYGARIQCPLVKSERISFLAVLRGGLVNEKFMVVVPGLETSLTLGKRIAVHFGMSMRMSYPSLSSKVALKLF